MYAPTAYATLSLTIAQYADHAGHAADEAAEIAARHPNDPYLATKAAAAASCHALATRTTRRYYARQWANDAKRMAREAHAHWRTHHAEHTMNHTAQTIERSSTMNHTAQTIERIERDLPNARRALLADLDEVESLLATAQEALENDDPEQAEYLAQDAQDALNELAH